MVIVSPRPMSEAILPGLGCLGLITIATLAFFWSPFDEQVPDVPQAGPQERIDLFELGLHIKANGAITVKERFHYDFGDTPVSSFHRHLTSAGGWYQTGNGLGKVKAHGDERDEKVSLETYGPNRWNDTEVIVDIESPSGWKGKHTFVVEYELSTELSETNGFSLDVISRDWTVPVEKFAATVTSDVDIAKVRCDLVRQLPGNCTDHKQSDKRHAAVGHDANLSGADLKVTGDFPRQDVTAPRDPTVKILIFVGVCLLIGVGVLVALSSWPFRGRRVRRATAARSAAGAGAAAEAEAIDSGPEPPPMDFEAGSGAGDVGSS